jgi:hypothetical protein
VSGLIASFIGLPARTLVRASAGAEATTEVVTDRRRGG